MTPHKDDTYKIRPAGRHILTIGRDLIHDQYAAIVELVKNAYDADSPDVNVTFKVSEDKSSLTIIVEDKGHGMSRDTVIDKWLVPSTRDKLERRTSPHKRKMQGRKGVGRYAASILGDDLLLETVTKKGEKTTVYVEWASFETADFLDDVEILVETEKTKLPQGTTLTITANKDQIASWKTQIDKLKFELKKLTSPINNAFKGMGKDDPFDIYLIFDNFYEDQEDVIHEKIEPYPIFDLYDYKISGKIRYTGKGTLTYTNQKARNTIEEKISFDLANHTYCGDLVFDLRVYDREKAAIDLIIKRGLKDKNNNYVGSLQARQILNENNGIGVYRNGFRIRPMGEPDFDWLELNKERVQNPSMRIGCNQVIGYVQIEEEELSGLEEKSARDGLRDNRSYERLKKIAKKVISELESRRFAYRQKAGLSRHAIKIEKELEKLFAFDDLKKGIRKKLRNKGIDKKTTEEVINIITKKEEDNNRIVGDIRETVAIYQGQATLGKIINVVLHEGRKPLNYFKNIIPDINFWSKQFSETKDHKLLNKIIPLANNIGNNADIFRNLFARLDPLAAGKRPRKKPFPLLETISQSFQIFESELSAKKIDYKIKCNKDFKFMGWPQDIYIIITNLVDNSIYWINEKKMEKRSIEVNISVDGDKLLFIDYKDSGPGIEPHLIESEVIFEPEFSTKPEGTGLGLAIAGETALRNNLELKAYSSDSGAYFRLQTNVED